jgi:hypothetical protein
LPCSLLELIDRTMACSPAPRENVKVALPAMDRAVAPT